MNMSLMKYVIHCLQNNHCPFTVSISRNAFHDLICITAVHVKFEDWNRVILEKLVSVCTVIQYKHATLITLSLRQINLLQELIFWNFGLAGVKETFYVCNQRHCSVFVQSSVLKTKINTCTWTFNHFHCLIFSQCKVRTVQCSLTFVSFFYI